MIVVSGEALFDVFAGNPSDNGLALEGRVGGSPFNVAIGLARLEQPAAFFGAISHDAFGRRLFDMLRSEGVRTDLIQQTSAPTTLSIVGLDADGVPSYTFHGEHGADRELKQSALAAIPPDVKAFHFGSYSMLVEPIGSTLRKLAETGYARHLIAYDPNVRLNVEPSLPKWRELLDWMVSRTHLLKVSEEDLGLLYPGTELEALASRWLAAGVALVVVTRGGNGAIAWTKKTSVARPGRKIRLVDTVGAGDSFHAALLTWLAEHNQLDPAAITASTQAQLESMLDFASLAASITCSRQGAQLPRRAELDS
jgi:fructokinase